MLEQGVGRRAWREKYPSDCWLTSDRKQLENGDRICIVKRLHEDRAAVLTFFDKDGDLHWVIHADGKAAMIAQMYALLVEEAENHPIAIDYTDLVNFGRF